MMNKMDQQVIALKKKVTKRGNASKIFCGTILYECEEKYT